MNKIDISYEMYRYFNLVIETLTNISIKTKGERREGINDAINIINLMLKEFESVMDD